MRFIIYLFLSFSILSCKNSDISNNKSPIEKPVFEVLPEEMKIDLHNRCDYIDYIFRALPISASFGPNQGIAMNIDFISDQPVLNFSQNCKPIARKMFQSKANIILEADVVYGEGCMYYVFYINGKSSYASMMTQQGVNFYANIISSVNKNNN